MKYKFKTTPFKHQYYALKICLSQPNTALLLDPGLGKTKIAIDNAGARYMRDGLNRVLILCPKVLLGNWEDEIAIHLPDEIPRAIFKIKGNKKERLKHLGNAIQSNKVDLSFIIITYESLVKRKITNKDGEIDISDEYFRMVKKFKPQAVVCDESQLIKSHKSQRSKSAYQIGKTANNRLALTGTMITKYPLDVFGQYRFLDDSIFGTRYKEFEDRYAIKGGFEGREVIGYRDLPDLKRKVHSIAVRIRKEDCLDLPPKPEPKLIPVELEPKTMSLYKQMEKEKIIEIESGTFTADLAVVAKMRLHQITGGHISKRDELTGEKIISQVGNLEKINATIDLTELLLSRGEDEKVVIYAKFIWELKQLYSKLKKYNPLLIYGGSTDDYIEKAKKAFQTNTKYRIMIMQVSKGIGLTLTAARYGVFHSFSHKYDDFVQCQDRLHRIGQTRDLEYFAMIVKNTVDEEIYKAIKNKQNLAEYIQNHNCKKFKED